MSRDGPSSHADSQDQFHPQASDGHHRPGRDSYDVADSRDGDQRRSRFSHEGNFQSGGRDRSSRDFTQGFSAAQRNDSQGWGSLDNHEEWGSPPSDWRRGEQEEERGKGWDNRKDHRPQGNRRWQTDNGWESRKRDRYQNRRPPDSQDEPSKDERTWEPGPGFWHRAEQGYRNQRGRGGAKMKGKKNNQNRPRQRGEKDRDHDRRWDRDRRNENDSLNKYVLSSHSLDAVLTVSSVGKEESFTLCLPSQSVVLSSELLLPGHVHELPTLLILGILLEVVQGRDHSRRSRMSSTLAHHDPAVVARLEEYKGQYLLRPSEATWPEPLCAGEVSPLCLLEVGAGAGARVEVLGTDQGQNTDCRPPLPSEISLFRYPSPHSRNVPSLFSDKNLNRQETRRLPTEIILYALFMFLTQLGAHISAGCPFPFLWVRSPI